MTVLTPSSVSARHRSNAQANDLHCGHPRSDRLLAGLDQICAAGEAGGPAKTTMTPAYLSFQAAFTNNRWGQGAAIAFLLFGIIIAMAALQRWVLRDKDDARIAKAEKKRNREIARQQRAERKGAGAQSAVVAGTGSNVSLPPPVEPEVDETDGFDSSEGEVK